MIEIMSRRYTQMNADNARQSSVGDEQPAGPVSGFTLVTNGCTPTASLLRVYLRLSTVALLGLTNACVVGPDYQRPATETPAKYRFEEAVAQDIANAAWWALFQDEQLSRLISIALA